MLKLNLGVSAHILVTTATMAVFAFAPAAFAHSDHANTNTEQTAQEKEISSHFERLPGKKGAPIGFDKE